MMLGHVASPSCPHTVLGHASMNLLNAVPSTREPLPVIIWLTPTLLNWRGSLVAVLIKSLGPSNKY